jgi:hypothetical protein
MSLQFGGCVEEKGWRWKWGIEIQIQWQRFTPNPVSLPTRGRGDSSIAFSFANFVLDTKFEE